MRRTVILTIEDDVVESITYYGHARKTLRSGEVMPWTTESWHAPVPPDDQLTRDLDEVTRSTLDDLDEQQRQEGLGHDGLALRGMALRIRAAADLDDE